MWIYVCPQESGEHLVHAKLQQLIADEERVGLAWGEDYNGFGWQVGVALWKVWNHVDKSRFSHMEVVSTGL